MVILNVRNYGEIDIELDWDSAPNTCANFVELAKNGYYDGLTFHRIIKHFMIQGGCPIGNGTGGPGYSIKGEFKINGFRNDLKHERGVISMARSYFPDSAGSQFFICDADDFFLDGQYAAFGKVTKGMDVVDKIAAVKTSKNDRPFEPIVIESAKVMNEPDKEAIKIVK